MIEDPTVWWCATCSHSIHLKVDGYFDCDEACDCWHPARPSPANAGSGES